MSIFDHPDTVPTAPSWRCPHCATLQPETTRCWACLRSPVACGSCQFFRESIVSELTYCGLDQARAPVGRDEVRTCWRPNSRVSDAQAVLFTEAQLEPDRPSEPNVPTTERTSSRAGPAAAKLAVADDGLVEAPHVAPARALATDPGWAPEEARPRRSDDLDLD
jgi:hypothetical protein